MQPIVFLKPSNREDTYINVVTGSECHKSTVFDKDLVVSDQREGFPFIASKEDITTWFQWGKESKHDFMLIVVDTDGQFTYPIFVSTSFCWPTIQKIQQDYKHSRVHEVYNLSDPIEPQMESTSNWKVPPRYQSPPATVVPDAWKAH